MAERRMFSKRVISSGRFLKMPPSTQVLYFHLGMNADDDGVVEAYRVMQIIGATEDDLKLLAAKKFVVILNDDLVTYILDWTENNKIRSDRKTDSIYRGLLVEVVPDVNLLESKERADKKQKPVNFNDYGIVDNQRTSNGQPMDNQRTSNGRHRIGKDRIGKDSIGKDSIGKDSNKDNDDSKDNNNIYIAKSKPKEPKHKHGEYQNVLLTDTEMTKLMNEFPADYRERIDRLSEYMKSTGKSYKDHLATIRVWAKRDNKPKEKSKSFMDINF